MLWKRFRFNNFYVLTSDSSLDVKTHTERRKHYDETEKKSNTEGNMYLL